MSYYFLFAEFKPKQKNTVAKVLWLVLLSGNEFFLNLITVYV